MAKPPKQKSFFDFFNRVFIALSGVILVITLLCGFILLQLYVSVAEVVQSTVPSVNRISSVGSNTLVLSNVVPRMKNATSLAEVETLETQTREVFSAIEQDAWQLSFPYPFMPQLVSKLTELEQLINQYSSNSKYSIELTQKAQPQAEQLLQQLQRLSQHMQLAYIEAESKLFAEKQGEALQILVADTQFISEISHNIELLSVIVLNTISDTDTNGIEQKQEEFNAIYRHSAFTSTNLTVPLDAQSFVILRQIYQLALAENNYFESKKAAAQAQQGLLALDAELEEKLSSFASFLRPFLEQSANQGKQTLTQLSKDTQNYFWLIGVVSLLAILVVAFVNRHIVPHHIVTPLRTMAQDIVQLSKNDGQALSFPHETLELAEVRKALLVFQANSEALFLREKELLDKNQELDSLNSSLKTFIRISSHDLRTPLRGVYLLANMIKEDIGDNDMDSAMLNLERILNRAQRMENLVIALSQYMRAENSQSTIKQLNPRQIIEEQFALVNINDCFTLNVDVEIKLVSVAEVPFTTVVRNILDNAIKHHDQEQGRLVVILDSDQQYYYVTVTDDGPGIPERFHERVFRPFETLQPKDDIEGAGMGLAIIEKLVKAHGGTMTLVSPVADDRGSAFRFSWLRQR